MRIQSLQDGPRTTYGLLQQACGLVSLQRRHVHTVWLIPDVKMASVQSYTNAVALSVYLGHGELLARLCSDRSLTMWLHGREA